MRDIFLCWLLAGATVLGAGYVKLAWETIKAGLKFGCTQWIVTAITVGLFFSLVTFVGHQAGVNMTGLFSG